MLKVIIVDDELLEVGSKAVEEQLIKYRDHRMSEPLRANGCVIRERDGRDSSVIRFGMETALRVALQAIQARLAMTSRRRIHKK